jgi:hypothetical protein
MGTTDDTSRTRNPAGDLSSLDLGIKAGHQTVYNQAKVPSEPDKYRSSERLQSPMN